MYLKYVIGRGELKIEPPMMKAIMKWLVPINVYEVKNFVGVTKYLRKFVTLFSIVATPLHPIIVSGKRF